MKPFLLSSFFVFVGLTLVNCAAPGSSLTQTSIRGQLVDQHNRPLTHQKVQLMLPAANGLSGFDAQRGKPQQYGHRDQFVTLTTDSKGRFSHDFAPNTYSITYFLLPPLGPVPRTPPKPSLALRKEATGSDYYLIANSNDRLDYRVYDGRTSALRPDTSKRISGDYVSYRTKEGFKGWQMDVTVTR